MADAYVKTFEVDETFVLEDTLSMVDIAAFQLDGDAPEDMYLWSNAFTPASGNTSDLYAWVAPMPLDTEGNYIDNFYNNTGVLWAILTYSTLGHPTNVRLHGTVKCMYLPVVESTP
jgi:hypothetical protein